jgi:kumamolisin
MTTSAVAKHTNHSYIKRARPKERVSKRAAAAGPWSVPDLCTAYKWPTGLTGGGVLAIVELGGGWTPPDMQAYFKSIGQPMPTIADVSVDGTKNAPGGDADGEVALDIQVAAAAYFVATGKPLAIRVYWAQDIATAVRAAAKDGCDVCSISWGADEAQWGPDAAKDMDAAALEAAKAGMAVFAASGDNDSSDGGDTPANVDLPAGCPHIIGCGGTSKTPKNELVWNNNPGQPTGEGTGGGFSTLFKRPAWQPVLVGAPDARVVPDIAANADPDTGYRIYYAGSEQIVGGTSAVAPLISGLCCALGKKLGHIAPALYRNPGAFADITSGDNGMYKAQTGFDPCTGLGAPIGQAINSLFAPAAPVPQPTPAPKPPAPSPTPPAPAPSLMPTLVEVQAMAISRLETENTWLSKRAAIKLVKEGLAESYPQSSAAKRK